ncbi:glycosyltransferase [Lactobacillus equicursoris]|uniref:glycosyltransferase n=1 Tax=Lactobacillus equicursoris TaxID=420645 RepID=UPI0039942DCC
MRKIKVLIVDAFQGLGGEEEISYYVYQNLDREKFDVSLAGPAKAEYFKKMHPNEDEWKQCTTQGKLNFHEMRKFRQLVKRENIDIVNVHGYSAGYFVRLACMGLKNTKVVWTMHLNLKDVNTMSKPKLFISTAIENVLSRFSLFTDAIICVSKSSVKDLRNRHITKTPIKVIYNGVNISRFSNLKKNKPAEYLKLGFMARLSPQKGVPVLLDTMKKLADESKKIKLYIAGDGELREYVEKFIADNNLAKQITLLGFQKDITKVLSMIDVAVLPSYYECLPVIILEAGSAGIPTIASNVNGIPEEIEDGVSGFLFERGSIDQFARCIDKYYNNPNLIHEHGVNAQKLVKEKFNQEKMIKQYEKLFEDVMHNAM